jgi:hypothetical protein
MWTESLLKKFNLRVSGDDGGDDDDDDDAGNNDDNGKKGGNDDDGSGGDDDDDDGDDDPDDDLTPEEYKKQIKKLRAENAKRRLKEKKNAEKMNKFEKALKVLGGDDDDDDPDKKLDAITSDYESAVTRTAVLELALENGISGSENLEYFEFLMGKALNSLDEGDEMTEEQLEEILEKCSAKGGGEKANTSTRDKGKGKKKPEGDQNGEVTQEEFDKMGMMGKSALYQKNPELYEKLRANSSAM